MRFIRFTMAMQLAGFMAWGWIVGGLAEYRIQRERAFTVEVLIQVPMQNLSEFKI